MEGKPKFIDNMWIFLFATFLCVISIFRIILFKKNYSIGNNFIINVITKAKFCKIDAFHDKKATLRPQRAICHLTGCYFQSGTFRFYWKKGFKIKLKIIIFAKDMTNFEWLKKIEFFLKIFVIWKVKDFLSMAFIRFNEESENFQERSKGHSKEIKTLRIDENEWHTMGKWITNISHVLHFPRQYSV